MTAQNIITVGLVDDHILLRHAMSYLISGCENKRLGRQYKVSFQADNGRDMIRKLQEAEPPEIILLDVNMPEMNGFHSAEWLRMHCPMTKVIAFSMGHSDSAVIRMLKKGSRGYLTKDISPEELIYALDSLVEKGFYYSEEVVKQLVNVAPVSILLDYEMDADAPLNEREIEFLRMIGEEWSYKEIADRMLLSPRTIDGYRDALFLKLNVRTRVGLLMYAVKCGIINKN